MEYIKYCEKQSADRLFDVISGFYSLFDNGKATDKQKVAALAACDVLESKYNVKTMQKERDTIEELTIEGEE